MLDSSRARLVHEANFYQITTYLGLFPALRVRMVRHLRDDAWLAVAANRSEWRQRCGGSGRSQAGFWASEAVAPLVVRLARSASRFDAAIAHFDGRTWWYGGDDYNANPAAADQLLRQFRLRQYERCPTSRSRSVTSVLQS